MSAPFRVGIAGLGTVGCGVVKILQKNAKLIEQRAGRRVEIVCVSAKSKKKKRDVDVSKYEWIDDPLQMAARKDIDCIVEVMGGSEGAALHLVKKALGAGKHIVTANKALLAHHGAALAELADKNAVSLSFEAAVAGGVPAIKALREGAMANHIHGVYGILNGTCNYILTQMRESGRGFKDVLKEAQSKGYAEADPEFDIEGVDAGHKICLLAAIAFGIKPDFKNLKTTGISHLDLVDIKFAQELGYKIKLLGIARDYKGKILQTVEPCLVPRKAPIASVEGVFNAVFIEGDFIGKCLLTGRGAGEGPTASAVVADIIDLARGIRVPAFGVDAAKLKKGNFIDAKTIQTSFYLRLNVLDKPGVIADVSAILRDYNISIEAMLQHGHDPGAPVHVVIKTHKVQRGDMEKATALIGKLKSCKEKPCLIRIADEL